MDSNHRIVILIGFIPNPRIINRINIEKSIGSVHLICWNRGNSMQPIPNDTADYSFHSISIEAGNDPLKRIPAYIGFRKRALTLIKEIKPQVIHVQGIDMLMIAAYYKKRFDKNTRIIYEIADLHRYIVDVQKDILHKAFRKILVYQDKKLEALYNLLIITSEAYYDAYFTRFVPASKVMFVPNQPNYSFFSNYKKKNDGQFTVGYIGGVRYKKQIRNLLCASHECNDIPILIAGYEEPPIEIEPLCKDKNNIEWIGKFSYSDRISELYEKCDVMYSVYDADMSNVRVALPNKLYESIFCEMPIIVAKGTYLAELVERWNVGVAVNHRSVEELTYAIKQLKNNHAYYSSIVESCRKIKRNKELFFDQNTLRERIINLIKEKE